MENLKITRIYARLNEVRKTQGLSKVERALVREHSELERILGEALRATDL